MAVYIDGLWYSNACRGNKEGSVGTLSCCGFEYEYPEYFAVCADDIVYYEIEEPCYYV
jgi:hypothetical protein